MVLIIDPLLHRFGRTLRENLLLELEAVEVFMHDHGRPDIDRRHIRDKLLRDLRAAAAHHGAQAVGAVDVHVEGDVIDTGKADDFKPAILKNAIPNKRFGGVRDVAEGVLVIHQRDVVFGGGEAGPDGGVDGVLEGVDILDAARYCRCVRGRRERQGREQ